jgi:hypothetical protein
VGWGFANLFSERFSSHLLCFIISCADAHVCGDQEQRKCDCKCKECRHRAQKCVHFHVLEVSRAICSHVPYNQQNGTDKDSSLAEKHAKLHHCLHTVEKLSVSHALQSQTDRRIRASLRIRCARKPEFSCKVIQLLSETDDFQLVMRFREFLCHVLRVHDCVV